MWHIEYTLTMVNGQWLHHQYVLLIIRVCLFLLGPWLAETSGLLGGGTSGLGGEDYTVWHGWRRCGWNNRWHG